MSQALKKFGFDLLIVGGLTDDGSTGAVPGALAEHLGLPCITNARKVDIERRRRFEVERETDGGYQSVHGPLPALITTALTFGEPRYASLKGIMGAKKKTIALLTRRICAGSSRSEATDRRCELGTFAPPPPRGKGRIVEATDGAAGAQAIFDFLKRKEARVA